jgi:hypothetical protein
MGRVPLFRLSAPTVDSVALSFRDLSQPAPGMFMRRDLSPENSASLK